MIKVINISEKRAENSCFFIVKPQICAILFENRCKNTINIALFYDLFFSSPEYLSLQLYIKYVQMANKDINRIKVILVEKKKNSKVVSW